MEPTILKHPEFAAYSQKVTAIFEVWRAAHKFLLNSLKQGAKARDVITALLEDLLAPLPLLSKYDGYQRLMD